MTYPAHIQSLLNHGLAYEDTDGCVRLLPAYCGSDYIAPNIHIHNHIHLHYHDNNQYSPIYAEGVHIDTNIEQIHSFYRTL